MPETQLPEALLSWDKHNHPHSSIFNDHYYSLVDGLEESRHVFLEGNNLHCRWEKLKNKQSFNIMELGFGSGLNFLATWQLWNSMNISKDNRLHYFSVEAFPMSIYQLQKSLTSWKDSLSDLSIQLLENYPPLEPGCHTINFKNNVTLSLIFSDVRNAIPKFTNNFSGSIDAWYLDGFSPAKNPEMWSDDIFKNMNQLSKPLTTIATYTIAGSVRRGLSAAGFFIQRRPGFATKRDMLTAHLPHSEY